MSDSPSRSDEVLDQNQLRKLTSWSSVAIALRAAARVRPLRRLQDNGTDLGEGAPGWDQLLTLAENAVRRALVEPASHSLDELADLRARIGKIASSNGNSVLWSWVAAVETAAAALLMVEPSRARRTLPEATVLYSRCLDCLRESIAAIRHCESVNPNLRQRWESAFRSEIVRDFETAAASADHEKAAARADSEKLNSDRIPRVEELGPIWPEGEPEGWPIETDPYAFDESFDLRMILDMPHWAAIAVAVRVARRVLPLLGFLWPEAPESERRAITSLVALVEEACRSGAPPADWHARFEAATSAFRQPPTHSGAAVQHIALAAASAVNTRGIGDRQGVAVTAADAIVTLRNGRSVFGETRASELERESVRDLLVLRELAVREGWTDDTPVAPDTAGPLWHNGEPEWGPKGTHAKMPPVLTVLTEELGGRRAISRSHPGRVILVWDSEVVTPEDYAELVAILGDLAREGGAAGISRIRSRGVFARALEGVPT